MKENKNLDFAYFDDENDTVNIREVLEKYLFHYKWFLLGVVLAVLGAYSYLRYTPKQYKVAATILIDDEKKGGLSSELSAFEDLGILGGGQTNIDNEIGILKSRSLMERVAKDLKLNITYSFKGSIRQSEVFENDIPFKLSLFVKDAVLYQLDTTFSIKRISKDAFILKNGAGEEAGNYNFGKNINTDFGSFTVTPRNGNGQFLEEEITVKIAPMESVVDGYRARIQIVPNDKKSSLVNLTMQTSIKQKAVKILDYLVVQYNKDAIEDKGSIAKNTDAFINERIAVISKDLTLVDKGVEDFKTSNKLTNIEAEAGLILNTNNSIEQKIIALNTQLKLAEYVTVYINNNAKELIPANLGLKDENTNENTSHYNELLLEYNRILNSSGKLNPILLNLEAQILKLQESIKQSLVNLTSSLSISLHEAKLEEIRLHSRIRSVPKQEREFRDIQRQQQIIETLYLYLLEKREENAISLAVTAPNAKIIDKAHGSRIPVAPKPKIIYLAAILLGLAIPFMVIFLISMLDNKVHTIEDVEREVGITVLGDIPKFKTKENFIITREDKSPFSESFRMLRTNVFFMLSNIKDKSKTIFVTSTISKEGKTPIAINIASVLALSGKHVLLIGGDVRNPKLTEYLDVPKKEGLTHFLMDKDIQADKLIERVDRFGFDMLQSGVIPPNPSELFTNSRFDELLAYGKDNYDFVIVDTAPVSLVTDTMLLSHNKADLFIYVVRANFLDKRMLKVPQKLFETKRLENMAILLNDTNPERMHGYGYGYGYGYGEQDAKKSWWKRILKM